MSVIASLNDVNPFSAYGLKPNGGTPASSSGGGSTSPGLASQASAGNTAPPWHPDNALFWFAAVALVAVGAVGASTSARVGPFRASVAAGKTGDNK